MNRVVISGVGVVSPVGIGRDNFWNSLINGRSGIGPITLFNASTLPVRIGGQVKEFDISKTIERFPETSSIRDRKVFLALDAAKEAITDAELLAAELKNALLMVGVGLESICLEDLTPYTHADDIGQALFESTLTGNGNGLVQTPLDYTAAILGKTHGFQAGRFTNCSACAAGTQVVGDAWRMLRRGKADIALAGATDSMLNPLGLGGFSLLKILSDENEHPQQACRPFDATRQGTVLGEGAAFVVLEVLEHALARDAKIYAEVLGYGSSLDAYAVSDPDPGGRGAISSIKQAIRSAGLCPDDIDCVNAHGTGTPKNDVIETAAIKDALGRRAYEIPIHAVKSMTGHMIAASGAAETVAAALTITNAIVPPTINLKHPDPNCDLDYVAGVAKTFDGETVLSNSFGFGGQNATLILGRYKQNGKLSV
jgi:3-oxoacyl-[acyl-carrier-protein] synthase II